MTGEFIRSDGLYRLAEAVELCELLNRTGTYWLTLDIPIKTIDTGANV